MLGSESQEPEELRAGRGNKDTLEGSGLVFVGGVSTQLVDFYQEFGSCRGF